MSEKKTLIELIKSLEESFEDILKIFKAMGNKKRLKILTALLTGKKTFNYLKKETKLQKTALSNHLTILIDSVLIEKPDHGSYQITQDGELFIRMMEETFIKSNIWSKKQTEIIQRRQFSDSFLESFFGRS